MNETDRFFGLLKEHSYRMRVVTFPSISSPFEMVWLFWSPSRKDWGVYGVEYGEQAGPCLKKSDSFYECLDWMLNEKNHSIDKDGDVI